MYYKESIFQETGNFLQLQENGNAIIIHWQTNWQLNYMEKNRYVKDMDGGSQKAKIKDIQAVRLAGAVRKQKKRKFSSASSNWKCYHYTLANKLAIKLFGEKSICEKHGRKFTKGINKRYPGCGTCWCCQKAKGKPPKCRNKCHKKAMCRKGKCVCQSKYQGDGVKSCKKAKKSAYFGCYQDHSKRILPKDVLTDKRMTVQKCRQFCGKKDSSTQPISQSAGTNVIRKRSVEKENAFVKANTKATELNLAKKVKRELSKNCKGYRIQGRISLTQTGRTCQYWERQYPHKHPFSISFKTEHNYCRNPDNSGQPWCYTNDPTTRWEYCQIPMCAPEDPEDVDECRKSAKGTEYKGRISLTQTGRTCQYWERQYPHKHPFSISFKTEHNYCRNPDNSGQPWCYTNDPTTRWEYCQIPMCAACSVREEIVECKATVRVSGSCFYKSKVGSSCVYAVQLSDSQAIIKTSTQEMVLTNGGNLAECAIFTFNDGTLKIEDDVCKCFEATVVNK
ncbi:Plasminogen,Hepatocyte growth factor [Mytilus edulis]|uniref:Plasminogen,Hepatocyte growth factor n=1 Tax=Mytilus edulis TaxID=6550 RepID=A0A8S3UU32_MYTED|nr:Plasminogen,Hepatocyte growth factor [Mytilus edulis]